MKVRRSSLKWFGWCSTISTTKRHPRPPLTTARPIPSKSYHFIILFIINLTIISLCFLLSLWSPAFIADWSRHAIPKEIRDEHLITLDEIARLPSPRIVKTHHPTLLMHPQVLDGCKVQFDYYWLILCQFIHLPSFIFPTAEHLHCPQPQGHNPIVLLLLSTDESTRFPRLHWTIRPVFHGW